MNITKNRLGDTHVLRKNIGLFIRGFRVNRSLTGAELGGLLEVSQQKISRYENRITSINIETLDKILGVLGSDWIEFYQKVLVNDADDNDSRDQDNFSFYLKYL